MTSSRADRRRQQPHKRDNGEMELPDADRAEEDRETAQELEGHSTPTTSPIDPAAVRPEPGPTAPR